VSGQPHTRLLGDVFEALPSLLGRFPAVASVIADQLSLFVADAKFTVAEPASLFLNANPSVMVKARRYFISVKRIPVA
jgi:hypothetical protein